MRLVSGPMCKECTDELVVLIPLMLWEHHGIEGIGFTVDSFLMDTEMTGEAQNVCDRCKTPMVDEDEVN